MTQVRQREAQQILESMSVARYQMYPEYRDSGVEWLGEIPAHWDTVRLKYICHASALYGANLSANEYVNDGVRFLRTSDIDDFGNLIDANAVYVDRLTVQNYLLGDGDILLSRSGTIGRSFVYEAQKHEPSAYAGYLVRFVPNDLLVSQYAFYFTKSQAYYDWVAVNVIESTIGNLNGQKYANMPLTLPPPDEQRAITTFLDRQTAKIDALIAKKRELIAALHEQRSAIISHAVTKGLNPDAPVKDSGIEWVDSIPAHWQVQRLKFVADVRSGVAKGRKFEGVKTVELPYLRVANVQAGHIDLSDVAEIEVTVSEIERYCLKVGDVLMNEGGDYDKLGRGAVWQGQIEPCLHQNHVFAVRPYQQSLSLWITTLTLAQYARFYFMINSKQSTNLASISSRNLSEFPVIMPPQSEREQILGYIEDETRHIDRLTAKAEETIERLQEYRAALISAAVTGKIDVRGA